MWLTRLADNVVRQASSAGVATPSARVGTSGILAFHASMRFARVAESPWSKHAPQLIVDIRDIAERKRTRDSRLASDIYGYR